MRTPTLLVAARTVAPYVLCAVGLIVLVAAAVAFIGSPGYGYDYQAYDAAARRIASGQPLYLPGTAEAYNAGRYAGLYLYAPPAAVLMVPLTLLSPGGATLAWLLGRIAVLVLACLALPVRREVRAAVLGVAGLSMPVLFDLNLGNLSVVVFALSVLVRYPSVTVLLSWVLRWRLRDVGLALATVLAVSAASVAIVGAGTWAEYLTIVRSLGNLTSGEHNVTVGTIAAALALPSAVGTLATVSGVLLGLGAVALSALRSDDDVADVVALTSPLIVAPFFHPHYLVILLLPAAFLAGRGRWWGLLLPLLAWLPDTALPLVALAGVTAPLLAGKPPPATAAATASAT
jgi:Glycosyltransferase family 87